MIIIISGFHRTGSTVLFNYIKDIIKPTISKAIFGSDEKNLKNFIKSISNFNGDVLIKLHVVDESFLLELEKISTVRIIFPIRNLKDSISSNYKMCCHNFNVLTDTYISFKQTLNTLSSLYKKLDIVLYDDLVNDTSQVLKSLLKKYNIKYTDEQITDSINRWSLSNVKNFIATVDNQDEDTLFYHNHISSSLGKDIPERYLKIILDMLSSEIEAIKQNTKIDLLNI